MSPERYEFTNGGSRDCGRFFLDVVGKFTRQQIDIAWDDRPRVVPDALDHEYEQTWLAESEQAAKRGASLYNGALCRLIDFSADDGRLSLTLGPTNFREFLGSNLMRAHLRYVHGPEVLANPVGVSTAVTTADGFLLLGRRSQKVVFNAGKIHPIGGMLDPVEAPNLPDPFDCILQELRTETNVSPDTIDHIVCMGLVRDKRIVQPELVFDARLNIDAATLRRMAAQASDAHEHDNLILLMDYPSSVVTFMETHAEVLTPVATATLLLHGLRHWGSGWFASARGYLQSVI
jgi:hypothetical protein